jgi:hypothetical protein
MKARFLALALTCGALAVPAVALASGGEDGARQSAPSTAPIQQDEQQQPRDRDDCPEHDSEGGESSGSGGETQL